MNNKKIILLINSFWAIPAVFIIRIINIFKPIRIIKIRSDRFGHFSSDGAEQVARHQFKDKTLKLYIFDWHICNKQWAKMLSSSLPVYNWLRIVFFWNKFIPGGDEINENSTKTGSRDIHLLYTKHDVKLKFSELEDNIVKNWLYEKGWQDGEPFYCLLIRDNHYLKNHPDFQNVNFSYHEYRNSELKSYYKSIKWLIKKGVWVIRMGKVMGSPVEIHNKKIIDFPFDKNKSDLIDTWLFANCDGCISTGTGPDILSGIYNKNILFLNYLPLFTLRSDLKSITFPKKLKWNKTQKEFSLDEYISDKRLRMEDYKKDGIEIIDMTEEEILNAVIEFYKINNNKFIENHKTKNLREQFWKKVVKLNKKDNIWHFKIHPESRPGISWMQKF